MHARVRAANAIVETGKPWRRGLSANAPDRVGADLPGPRPDDPDVYSVPVAVAMGSEAREKLLQLLAHRGVLEPTLGVESLRGARHHQAALAPEFCTQRPEHGQPGALREDRAEAPGRGAE